MSGHEELTLFDLTPQQEHDHLRSQLEQREERKWDLIEALAAEDLERAVVKGALKEMMWRAAQ